MSSLHSPSKSGRQSCPSRRQLPSTPVQSTDLIVQFRQAKLRDDIKCASKQCLRSSLSSHIDRPDLNFDIFLHSRLARLFALTLNVEKYLGHRQWTRLPPLRSFSPSLCLQLLRLRRMQTRVWRLPTLSTTDRDSMLGALLHDYCVYGMPGLNLFGRDENSYPQIYSAVKACHSRILHSLNCAARWTFQLNDNAVHVTLRLFTTSIINFVY
jgi:hypothetical protein